MRTLALVCLLLLAACEDHDGSAPEDAAVGPGTDAAGLRPPSAPGGVDPVVHARARPLPVAWIAGLDRVPVLDVSVDRGGGVWAVTAGFVVYQAPDAEPVRLDSTRGLARGNPGFRFASVGAGLPGQAVIGSVGGFFDVVDVAPSGAITVHAVEVTDPIDVDRLTIGLRAVVDLDSAYGGTAWLGAEHGVSAIHGMATGTCWGQAGCFQEHRHPDPGGPSGDVRGVAVCADHDVWTGDARWLARMPWGGAGATPDFWSTAPGGYPDPLLEPFPGVDFATYAIACDAADRLWVATYGNGLLMVDGATLALTRFDAENGLPQNLVTSVVADPDGSVWIATVAGGVARYRPDTDTWTYHTEAAGLPSDEVNALAIDPLTSPRSLYLGHARGLSRYRGQ